MTRPTEYPYQALGRKLKAARVRKQFSIAEASGAIEVNEDLLQSIEQGKNRPAEDTLAVLLSYLDINDEEASQLWDLAGYRDTDEIVDLGQQVSMVLPGDLRVVYTDMVHVMVNDFGVVMNFMQGFGPNNQPLAIARIGMSKEHARSVLKVLDKSLKQSEDSKKPKMLKPADKPQDKSDKK